MDVRRCKIHTKKFDNLLENGVKVDLFLGYIIYKIVKRSLLEYFSGVFFDEIKRFTPQKQKIRFRKMLISYKVHCVIVKTKIN